MAKATIYPTVDTHISQVYPTSSYGTYSYIYAGCGSQSSYKRRAFLKFDFSVYAGATVNSARLYVYSEKDNQTWNTGTIYCGVANSDAWSNTTTWEAGSGITGRSTPAPQSCTFAGYGNYFSFNVKDQVQWMLDNGTNPGFVLYSATTQSHKRFPSREASKNRPYLVIDYIEGSGAIPAGNLLFSTGSTLRRISGVSVVDASGVLRSASIRGIMENGVLRPLDTSGAGTVEIAANKTARIRKTYATTNYNSATDLLVGLTGYGGQYERTLLYFDLSQIPNGATITSAILKMYQYYYSGYEGENDLWMAVAKITSPWERSNVTWSSVGDSCTVVSSAHIVVPVISSNSGAGWKEYNITGSIQKCFGAQDYYGIALMDVTENSGVNNRKNYYDTTMSSSYCPTLIVSYE